MSSNPPSSSNSKVYAPDSSPISTRTAMSSVGSGSGSSSSKSLSARGGRNGSSSGRPNASSSSGSFGTSFLDTITRPAQPPPPPATARIGLLGGGRSFPSTSAGKQPAIKLDQYKYREPSNGSSRNGVGAMGMGMGSGMRSTSNGSAGGRSSSSFASSKKSEPVTISSGEEDSDGDERPQRKRKFKRGKPPSESPTPSPVKSREQSQSQDQRFASRAGSSSYSPINVVDSDEEHSDDDHETRRAKKLRKMTGSSKVTLKECRDALAKAGGSGAVATSILGTMIKRREAEASNPDIAFNKRLRLMHSQSGGGSSSTPISLASSRSSSVSSTTTAPTSESGQQRMRVVPSLPSRNGKGKAPAAKSRRRDDDSDDSGSDGGGGGNPFDQDSDREQSRRARNAVHWFNDVSEEMLIETIGCSAAQAKIITNLRPFEDADDAEEKLRRTKGVTGKLFTDYIDLLASFHTVDQVLKKCERRAEMLEKASSPDAVAADRQHLKSKPKGMADDFDLKDYQLDGVNWLSLRYRHETSCILADDMGTGKTCQVIAFLCDLKSRGEKGVNLVVAPSSTIENWSRELKRFGPSLNFIVFAGSQQERRDLRFDIEQDHSDLDVVLSSYNSATSKTDLRFFKKFGFNCCVYDEGHQLKNQNTNNYKNLMQVRANWRLLLTGTPLQNNLLELMSLLKFIMPRDFKNSTEAFDTIFKAKNTAAARGSQLSKSRVDRARRMMGPFVLRRLKDKVLTLPPKNIRVEYCDMTPFQGKVYRKVLARTRVDLEQQANANANGEEKVKSKKDQSSNILMRLRKAAIHPLLFRTHFTADRIRALARDYVKEPQFMDEDLVRLQEDFAINSDAELSSLASGYAATKKHQVPGEAWLNSGKILALQKLIGEIRGKGEKLVIFSQFEMCLFLLMAALDEMGAKWIAFSGRTKVEERQSVIDEFQTNPDIPVFLLTTKAGGVGVNLTAANWVIMLDQDFNPQNDKQAEDRCWRIGQEREVNVVKLISRGTIDEDILALGQQKLELAARVSGGEGGASVEGIVAPSQPGGEGGEGSAAAAARSVGAEGADTAAAVTVDLMDDDLQQEKTARSLMSKLRSRGDAEGKENKVGAAGGEDGDDSSDDGFELLE